MGRAKADPGYSMKQERLAALVASGASLRAAAASAKVGERTAYSWMADPQFRVHVARLRTRILDRVVGNLVRDALKARSTLRALVERGQDPIKLRAAAKILDVVIKLRDHTEIDARLAAVEELAIKVRKERR